jgi:hypothetical protein
LRLWYGFADKKGETNMRRILAGAAIAALAISPAIARDQDSQAEFITPSGNVGCTYTPKGGTATYEPTGGGPELICERVEPTYVTLVMGPNGRVKRIDNPGEQGCCSDQPKLAYGKSWSRGPFTCSSAAAGLTCNGPGGHGFFVSRNRIATR